MNEASVSPGVSTPPLPRRNLQRLAEYASIELDNASRDNQIGFAALKQFAESLRVQKQERQRISSRKCLFDPVTEVAMFRAIRQSDLPNAPQTSRELFNFADTITSQLEGIISGQNTESLVTYKAFLLDLARQLSALRQPFVESSKARHPYRP